LCLFSHISPEIANALNKLFDNNQRIFFGRSFGFVVLSLAQSMFGRGLGCIVGCLAIGCCLGSIGLLRFDRRSRFPVGLLS
jgi:hypothetical protein